MLIALLIIVHLIDHIFERTAGHVRLNNDDLLRVIAIVDLQDLMKIRMLYIDTGSGRGIELVS